MKMIHFSDTHVVRRGELLHGLDPCARLDALVADVNARHGDAELAIVTGDLVNRGRAEEYAELGRILGGLAMPWRLMLGNHDDRASFRAVFPDAACDENGFVEEALTTPAGIFVLLDTKAHSVSSTAAGGVNWGLFDEARQGWLERRLAEAGDRPVYLFMHHPPFALGVPSLDHEGNGLRGAERLAALLARHANLRHLFLGHVHRAATGSWRGIPYSAVRGTNHQVALQMRPPTGSVPGAALPVPKNHEAPSYAVVLLSADTTTVHYHDFLDRSEELFALQPNEHGVMKYAYRGA